MNSLWHKQHPLARNASFAERIAWHREHQTQCGCRPVPASLRDLLRAQPISMRSGAQPSATSKDS